jgi:hypothetical protein
LSVQVTSKELDSSTAIPTPRNSKGMLYLIVPCLSNSVTDVFSSESTFNIQASFGDFSFLSDSSDSSDTDSDSSSNISDASIPWSFNRPPRPWTKMLLNECIKFSLGDKIPISIVPVSPNEAWILKWIYPMSMPRNRLLAPVTLSTRNTNGLVTISTKPFSVVFPADIAI